MTPRAVSDTNVVVSAALKAGSVPASLVALALSGQIREFSTERLFRFLTALDQDVEIVIKRKPRSRRHARVSVIAA